MKITIKLSTQEEIIIEDAFYTDASVNKQWYLVTTQNNIVHRYNGAFIIWIKEEQ